MAGFPQDSDEPGNRGAAPLSQHPAFTAIIALWFAALLGLGCLVIPGIVLERLVIASRLPELFPMAAPPLGSTARLIIALTAAIGGALFGMVVAGRVASAQSTQRRHRRITARPINAREELGQEGLGGEGLGRDVEETPTLPEAPAASWLSLRHPRSQDEADADAPPADTTFVDHAAPAEATADAADEEEPESAPPPLAFLDADEPISALPISPAPAAARENTGADEGPAAAWQNAPLAELGLVQLVQRLGHSLDRRREWLARCEAEAAKARAAGTMSGAEEAVTGRAEEAAENTLAGRANPFLDLAARLDPDPEPAAPEAERLPRFAAAEPSPDPQPATPRAGEDPEAALRTALATLRRMSGAG